MAIGPYKVAQGFCASPWRQELAAREVKNREEKKMRRAGAVPFMMVACLMLCGCDGFEVKNTDGLRAAYEKIELAYSSATEIAARQDIDEKDRQVLIGSYNEAKASVNAFLEDVKTKSLKGVDVPKDAFEKSKANRDIDKFISDVNASRKGILPGVVFEFAQKIIDIIVNLHKKADEEAYRRFVTIINDNKMVAFEQVPAKLKQLGQPEPAG